MAPGYRASVPSRRSNRAYVDHDVFEGLPIRQWRRETIHVAPPLPLDTTITQSSVWDVELPWGMPKDSHLLPQHSQELLRAARSGRLYKRPAPQEEEEIDNEILNGVKVDKKEVNDEKDESSSAFVAKTWRQIPRNLEGPDIEYLAKRRKGLLGTAIRNGTATATMAINQSANAGSTAPPAVTVTKTTVRRVDAEGLTYTQDVVVAEGETVVGDVISQVILTEGASSTDLVVAPVRRKPPAPKKKHKGPGRGKKKKAGEVPRSVPTDAAGAEGIVITGTAGDSEGIKSEQTTQLGGDGIVGETEDTVMGEGDQSRPDSDDEDEGDEGEEGDEDDNDDDNSGEDGEIKDDGEPETEVLSLDREMAEANNAGANQDDLAIQSGSTILAALEEKIEEDQELPTTKELEAAQPDALDLDMVDENKDPIIIGHTTEAVEAKMSPTPLPTVNDVGEVQKDDATDLLENITVNGGKPGVSEVEETVADVTPINLAQATAENDITANPISDIVDYTKGPSVLQVVENSELEDGGALADSTRPPIVEEAAAASESSGSMSVDSADENSSSGPHVISITEQIPSITDMDNNKSEPTIGLETNEPVPDIVPPKESHTDEIEAQINAIAGEDQTVHKDEYTIPAPKTDDPPKEPQTVVADNATDDAGDDTADDDYPDLMGRLERHLDEDGTKEAHSQESKPQPSIDADKTIDVSVNSATEESAVAVPADKIDITTTYPPAKESDKTGAADEKIEEATNV